MMLGPMKKRVITASIVAFIIPTIILGVVFTLYSISKKEEIEELNTRVAEGYTYAFSGDFPVGHIVKSNDIKVIEVKQQSIPIDSYYITKENAEGIDLTARKADYVGRKLRVAAPDTTMITDSLFYDEEGTLDKDIRLKEFNMISLPSDLNVGDYIDIRITYPTAEDYIVISGKEVVKIGSTTDSNAVFLELSEEEIIRMSSAIVESFVESSIQLYAVKIVEPYEQLFHDENVNYVKKYMEAVKKLKEEKTTAEMIPGKDVPMLDESGEKMYDEDGNMIMTSGELVETQRVPRESELEVSEIAIYAGIPEEDVETIRIAIKENDKALLSLYEIKTITTKTPSKVNYPVKKDVAKVIAANPNLVDDIKAKYDIDTLIKEREDLIDTTIYVKDEFGNYVFDPDTGKWKEDTDAKVKLETSINAEIQAKKNERKEYLQNLIRAQY